MLKGYSKNLVFEMNEARDEIRENIVKMISKAKTSMKKGKRVLKEERKS